MNELMTYGLYFLGALTTLFAIWQGLGLVIIGEDQVGIVTKKFASKTLPPGRVIATEGEAGIQAETLAPGLHLFKWFWQFKVEKKPLTEIPPGQIGLVVAIDGDPIPNNRLLANGVDSNSFQNATAFLKNGGQKGKQLSIITAGKYRINTELFKVSLAQVTSIAANTVGIVTTFDGVPLDQGEIAGATIPGHNNFQDIQAFLAAGGKRGLQEQVILAGQWNLNPWFVSVKPVPMTSVPIGHVGVVTSYVGKAHLDISGPEFKHGDLVDQGRKGVWAKPLYPGMHPINTDTMKIDLIPTTNVVLNWATNRNEAHQLDKNLSSITVRSKDGFSYNLDVSVVIHIGATEASKVISRMGSMSGLISQVLEPTIGNYFRNSAQTYAALDFLKSRTEMQQTASTFVAAALKNYDVEAVDTLIGDIVLPPQLLETQTQRKLAEEMQKTYEIQQASQKQKEALNRQAAITEMQSQVVASEQQVKIAQQNAEAKVKAAEGDTKVAEQKNLQMIKIAEAEAAQIEKKARAEAAGIEAKGRAQAESYQAGVKAMGEGNFTLLETMGVIGKEKVKVIPDLVVNGGGGGGDAGGAGMGLFNVLMAQMVSEKMFKDKKTIDVSAPPAKAPEAATEPKKDATTK
jgi:uncharacterized membrane protein YqiK